MTKPQKVDMKSMDIAADKRERLKQIFPEAFTEGKLQFDQLQHALREWIDSDSGKERFGLSWPGKAECMKIIQQPSVATLKPARDESVNFDETENLFIEGDNLEVLKLLQRSYFGKVKMIYIDPPYNTGKEFIYPDKYSETLDTYLEYTGQKDREGRKFSTNTDSQGRYHSNWLSMMYPRLYLARNLLRDDGVIFISIDDNEQANLKALCDFIFGEENVVGVFIWQTKQPARGVPPKTMVMSNHEYVICYSKDIEKIKFRGEDRQEKDFSNPDNDPRGLWRSESMRATGAKHNIFTIYDPKTKRNFSGHWAFSQQRIKQMIKDDLVLFPKKNDGVPRQKKFIDSYRNARKAIVTSLGWFSTEKSTTQFMSMFDGEKVFDFPKPLDVIKFIVRQSATENDIILDFFAGSATTAHAVMQLNAEDKGNRKYICVQLPEPTDEKSEAHKAGYKTIADIGKERIRRAAKKIAEEKTDQIDLGFKTFKLARSNFKIWESKVEENQNNKQQLFDHVDHINASSTPENILYELLLKCGYPLTTKIQKLILAKKEVYSIEAGALLICLDQNLTQEIIDALTEANPQQVICLDAGFKGNDQLKTNAVKTFKSRAQREKSEIVFRTV